MVTSDIRVNDHPRARIFLSYSRQDKDFALWLERGLEARDIEVFRDIEDTLPGEEWWTRIKSLIARADAFVFILSPRSVASRVCKDEIAFAATLKKRLFPAVVEPADPAAVPETVGARQSVLFTDEGEREAALEELIGALLVDSEWVREHTRLYERATGWQLADRPRGELLSGKSLENAEHWLTEQPRTAEAPTDLHYEYIKSSREWSQRRKRFLTVGLAAGLAFAAALAAVALWQRNVAVQNQARAEITRNEALLSQSKVLATLSQQQTEQGDPTVGLLLALEALPDQKSEDESTRSRPYWAPAQVSLERALREFREIAVLRGHDSAITSVAVMPDGRRIISGSWDGTARIWDAQTEKELHILRGHTGSVQSVAVFPDGTRVVTGSDDKTARIWDVRTGTQLMLLGWHEGSVESVAVTPDGARVITGAADKTARVWDARTGAQLAVLKGQEFGGHHSTVVGVAVASDGSRIVTASWMTARVWDAQTMAELTLTGRETPVGQASVIQSVAITPDGTRIVTGSDDGSTRIWDARTGTEVTVLGPREGSVLAVALTPDGARIVTGSGSRFKTGGRRLNSSDRDNRIRIWDTRTGAEIGALKAHEGAVMSVAVTPDGTRIVTGSEDRTVRVWHLHSRAASTILKAGASKINAVAMTPDGGRIVTGADDKTARIWDARTGAELRVLGGHDNGITSVVVTADGGRIVTASQDSTVRVWDASTGAELSTFKGRGHWIPGVAVTPDGKRIIMAAGHFSGRHFSTDTSVRDNTARIWDGSTGTEVGVLTGHGDGVTSVAVTPDGTRIVTGSVDNTARVWDASTGVELSVLRGHGFIVTSVAVAPDGGRIVTGSWDRTARVWDVRGGAELLVLKEHTGLVLSVAVTPDGSRIVTGSMDGTARVWDAATGTELAVLAGHEGGVTSVAVAPDGSRVVTGSEDGTARVWQLFQTGESLMDRAKALAPRCLSPSQRERYFLTPTPPAWCSIQGKWPYDPRSSLIEGRELLRQRRDNEASSLFAEAVARDSTAAKDVEAAWAGAYIERGGNSAREGRFGEADALFAKALALDPSVTGRIDIALARAEVDYGKTLLRERKDEQARTFFARALARAPSVTNLIDDAWANENADRATVAVRESRYVEARMLLAAAVRPNISPANRIKLARAFNNLAWRQFLKGSLTEALADAENAISLSPNDPYARSTRGHIYLALGRIDQACADLDRSIAAEVDHPSTYHASGQCRELSGDRNRAIESYRKALEHYAHDDAGTVARSRAQARLDALTGPATPTPIEPR